MLMFLHVYLHLMEGRGMIRDKQENLTNLWVLMICIKVKIVMDKV